MRALFTADGFDSYGSIYSTADVSGGAVSFDQAASFNVGCGCPSCMRTAMLRDAYGVPTASGPGKPAAAAALNPATLLSDDIAGDRSTTATLAADGAPVVSTLNIVGDFDFFKIALKAGQTYEFSLLSKTGGPSGVPLADAYVELYDPSGQLVGLSDGGAHTTLNSVNSGFDAALTFTATTNGVYFVNARAFDQDPTNGNKGDFVGDYEVSARQVAANDPTAYRPLYTIDSPLHSIDWGSQVDRTSRNPDGDNGPRDNGAAAHGVVYNPTFDVSGKNVITYYFAKTGDVFVDQNPATPGSTDTMVALGMQDWEKAAFRQAFDLYQQVADVLYIEVQNRAEADFKLITYKGTPGAGASLLGRMSPPGEENEGQAEFNAGDARWTQEGMTQGGFYFPTLLHELGHGHGLAHPHDNGGRSSVMRGSDDGSVIGGGTADFDLSQQVFTIMSYNDGWATSPYGGPKSGGVTALETTDPFGSMGTLAPLDIAVIQDKYGVNEDWAKGDNLYELKDVNAQGTFYQAIWDAGGIDEMRYSGSRDATLDLRAATLQYEEGGGGRVSYAYGIHGGFVIANGATIENATSGSGNDVLNGNEGTNVLNGNAGADVISSFGGDDLLTGGSGDDTLSGGAGADQFWFDHLSGRDVVTDFTPGQDRLGFGGNGPKAFAELRISDVSRGGDAGALVTWGDGAQEVWLKAVTSGSLGSGDFVFV